MSLSYTTTYELTSCADCGVHFALPAHMYRELKETHAAFWCPNGHRLHYPEKSDAELERAARIRAEAKAARMEDRAEVAERRRRAEKGQRTRLLNRIQNGVCPHCKRSFADVTRHMASQHPDKKTVVDVNER